MLRSHEAPPLLCAISRRGSHKEDNGYYHFIKMCPISNISHPHMSNLFPPLLLFSTSNSNHNSPPLLAESNSLSFFVCKGPLLSSLRRALIRSATLNKEGKTEGERESGGGKERVIWKDRAAAETFGCQSIRREGLRGGRDSGAFDLCLSKGEQQEGPSQTICLSLLAPVPL